MSAYSLQLVNFLSIFDMKFVSDKCIPSFISIYYVSIVIIDENKNLVFFFCDEHVASINNNPQ